MKKILAILTFSLIVLTPIFSVVAEPTDPQTPIEPVKVGKTAQIQLLTNIEESPVSYDLFYGSDIIKDGTTSYKIEIEKPLTKNGKTDDFKIYASSNVNNDLSVKVKITPDTFKTTLNHGEVVYNSKIKPQVKIKNESDTLKAGINDNVLVNRFYLYWIGNDQLPAGKYTSNVKIEYKIN